MTVEQMKTLLWYAIDTGGAAVLDHADGLIDMTGEQLEAFMETEPDLSNYDLVELSWV